MSKHVFIDLPNQIIWPTKCAMCGSDNEKSLSKFDTHSSKTSVIPIPIPFIGAAYISRKSEIDVSYPICKICADKCSKVEFLSNKLGKICGIAFLVTIFILMESSRGKLPTQLYPVAWFFLVIEVVLSIISARSTADVPVRIHSFRKDSVELVFSSPIYAYAFLKLNKPYARPMSKARSIIGLKG